MNTGKRLATHGVIARALKIGRFRLFEFVELAIHIRSIRPMLLIAMALAAGSSGAMAPDTWQTIIWTDFSPQSNSLTVTNTYQGTDPGSICVCAVGDFNALVSTWVTQWQSTRPGSDFGSIAPYLTNSAAVFGGAHVSPMFKCGITDTPYVLQETSGYIQMTPICPADSSPNSANWDVNADVSTWCLDVIDRNHDKPQSPQVCYGEPIFPLTGSERIVINFDRWLDQWLQLAYDMRTMVTGFDPAALSTFQAPPSFGPLWGSSLHRQLVFQGNPQWGIQAGRGSGLWVSFSKDASGNYVADADVNDRLVAITGGWRYTDAGARSEEIYDVGGMLTSLRTAEGATLTFTYSDATTAASIAPGAGFLISVQDQTGRMLQFLYEQPADRTLPVHVHRIIDPSAATTDTRRAGCSA